MAGYDAIVVGLGATGSATLRALARRGRRVLGIEQFAPGHDRGSSHGETRIIRLGYFEHPSYVPLLREVYPSWREIEAASGRSLLTITGILEIGPPDSELVRGTLASSTLHKLPHEVLGAAELMRRYPAFRVPADFVGVLQPDGGFLATEPAVETQVALARAAGADVRSGTRVTRIERSAQGVRIEAGGETVEATAAVVCAGPWLASLVPDMPVRVTRQVLAWFRPKQPELLSADVFPVFMVETRHGFHYGFPAIGDRIKIAMHHHFDETADPDAGAAPPGARDEAAIRAAVSDVLPAADGPLLAAKTCLYTVTPDHDFIFDTLPGTPRIVIGSPCSGHGFKFAPVAGEILADLALDGATARDISRFRLSRFV
jgi:sarcosine oxidase